MPSKQSVFLIVFLAVFVLFTTFYFIVAPKLAILTGTNAHLGATLIFAEGDVEFRESQSQGWKIASPGMSMHEGMDVRVIGSGKAIINIDDGSSVRLASDSILSVQTLRPTKIVLINTKGSIYNRVTRSNRVYLVRAGSIDYQSMGTAYKTTNDNTEKGIEVYHSSVKVIGDNLDVTVDEGKKYYTQSIKDKNNENKISDISIGEIKKDEFIMWNKGQDEKQDEYKTELGVLGTLPPPALTISAPPEMFTTKDTTVLVKGSTEPTATIQINGDQVPTSNGIFTKEIHLEKGKNEITVKALDAYGNKSEKILFVTNIILPTITKKIEPTIKPTEKPHSDGYIKLYASAKDNGISFEYSVVGIDTTKGLKLIKNESGNPIYPGDDAQFIHGEKRSASWEIQDGKTWHFRICQYLDGSCGVYSNDVSVKAPSKKSESDSENVTSISLSGAGKSINWTIQGKSLMGFKIVWSKNDDPTYPPRNDDDLWDYDANPDARSHTLEPRKGNGTYKARVCQYLGGKCGIYSNQIEIHLD